MYIYLATATTTTTMSVITATHSRMRHLQQYVRKTTTNAPTSGRDASELHHIFANTARRVLVSNSICLHTTHNFSIYRISMYVCVYVCMYVVSQACRMYTLGLSRFYGILLGSSVKSIDRCSSQRAGHLTNDAAYLEEWQVQFFFIFLQLTLVWVS